MYLTVIYSPNPLSKVMAVVTTATKFEFELVKEVTFSFVENKAVVSPK